VNNNFSLFADAVCRIHVLINEMLAWKKNRSEDKSILHCKSVMVAQQAMKLCYIHYEQNKTDTVILGKHPVALSVNHTHYLLTTLVIC